MFVGIICLCSIALCALADQETLIRFGREYDSDAESLYSRREYVSAETYSETFQMISKRQKPKARYCFCTTVPCPRVGYNFLKIGGRSMVSLYANNANGEALIIEAAYKATPSTFGDGSATTTCTRKYARNYDDDGTKDCDAGHIFARRLGGPENEPLNIFPQDSRSNNGRYNMYEQKLYDCFMKYDATSVELYWLFTYDTSTNTMPSTVRYTATFTGGDCNSFSELFTN